MLTRLPGRASGAQLALDAVDPLRIRTRKLGVLAWARPIVKHWSGQPETPGVCECAVQFRETATDACLQKTNFVTEARRVSHDIRTDSLLSDETVVRNSAGFQSSTKEAESPNGSTALNLRLSVQCHLQQTKQRHECLKAVRGEGEDFRQFVNRHKQLLSDYKFVELSKHILLPHKIVDGRSERQYESVVEDLIHFQSTVAEAMA
ncbi:hypothetical protein GPALN_003791, partial [Globodera pallida]